MRGKNITKKEKEYIKNNYNKYTVRELAKKMNRNEASIIRVAKEYGFSKQKHKYWTEDEENYLRENYLSMTAEDMAKQLKRGVISVKAHLQDLNLTKVVNWTDEETEYLIKNYQDMDYISIGKVLNKTDGAIRAKCFDLNLVKNDRWTNEDEEKLRELYCNMPTRDVAAIMGRTRNAVKIKARKLGLNKYPYCCNYRYFENIDTEEKAYWLGFMSADGWIGKRDDSNSGVAGLEIQYSDVNHLRKFNKSLEGNYRITDRWRTCSLSPTRNNQKMHHTCTIRIFSIDMYNDLVKHGFTNDKSYTFKLPKTIPDNLMRHYMRGYFDGDGCFTFTKKYFSCSFVSASKEILYDFENVLHSVGITSTKICCYQRDGFSMMWRLYINQGDDNNKIKFLNYIYKDATVYLDRKYNKYIEVLQHYNEYLPHQSEMAGSF